jgi:hypothetical protein
MISALAEFVAALPPLTKRLPRVNFKYFQTVPSASSETTENDQAKERTLLKDIRIRRPVFWLVHLSAQPQVLQSLVVATLLPLVSVLLRIRLSLQRAQRLVG